MGAMGPRTQLASWQEPLSEEHDYVLDGDAFRGEDHQRERRKHTVHGLTQLVPLRGTPLSVMSIQVTRSPNPKAGRCPSW